MMLLRVTVSMFIRQWLVLFEKAERQASLDYMLEMEEVQETCRNTHTTHKDLHII